MSHNLTHFINKQTKHMRHSCAIAGINNDGNILILIIKKEKKRITTKL